MEKEEPEESAATAAFLCLEMVAVMFVYDTLLAQKAVKNNVSADSDTLTQKAVKNNVSADSDTLTPLLKKNRQVTNSPITINGHCWAIIVGFHFFQRPTSSPLH